MHDVRVYHDQGEVVLREDSIQRMFQAILLVPVFAVLLAVVIVGVHDAYEFVRYELSKASPLTADSPTGDVHPTPTQNNDKREPTKNK